MIKQIIREPLLHFVVLGGLLFGAWSWVNPTAMDSNENTIVVDQRQLEHLKTLWKAQWKREPSAQDLAAIIDRHVRQEVFYREALKMGLDRDDEIIRTRLAQKMEAVASDLSSLMKSATEAQLGAFYQQRADLFTLPAAVAFKQVLFLPSEADPAAMTSLLARLRAGEDVPAVRVNKLGVPVEWSLTSSLVLDNAFGGGFAEALAAQPSGQWVGPVHSGLGEHLVQIISYEPEHIAPYVDIHDYVAQQYQYYAVLQAQQQMFDELLSKYKVHIEASGVPANIVQEYGQP